MSPPLALPIRAKHLFHFLVLFCSSVYRPCAEAWTDPRLAFLGGPKVWPVPAGAPVERETSPTVPPPPTPLRLKNVCSSPRRRIPPPFASIGDGSREGIPSSTAGTAGIADEADGKPGSSTTSTAGSTIPVEPSNSNVKHNVNTADQSSKVVGPNPAAYFAILRPQNIPSSFGLVAAGALVASHSTASLLEGKVLLTAWAAASVAVGSCVLNDWFDLELDRVNKPDRPLVTGEVVPAHALLIGAAFLLAAVASAAAVHPAALQATILASVLLTWGYTPLLKPIPVIKNFVVGSVIAAAIAAGGLAAGAGVSATLAPSFFTFFVIVHREILMDITDVEGDKEAGVQTLPVLLGREAALRLSVALVTAGIGFAGEGIISGTAESTRPIAAGLSTLFVVPLYANIFQVAKSDFSTQKLSTAVEQALGPLALVLGLMGFVLR